MPFLPQWELTTLIYHEIGNGAALGSSSRSSASLFSHSSDVPLGQANPSLPWQERYKAAEQKKGNSKQWKGSLGFHGLRAMVCEALLTHDSLGGHGETPRGIYNKMMGIRLFEGCGGNNIFGIVYNLFWDVSHGLWEFTRLSSGCWGWIKSGERKELKWIGKKHVWEKRSIKRADQCACLSPACTWSLQSVLYSH